MPGTLSRAATKCISEVPGLVKQTFTPPPSKVRTRLSAPFMVAPMAFTGSVSPSPWAVPAPWPCGAKAVGPPRSGGHSIVPCRLKGKEPRPSRNGLDAAARRIASRASAQTLEGAQAETEGLRLVVRLLDDGIGIVRPQRTQGRVPGQPHAHRSPWSKSIAGQSGQRGGGLVD